MLDHTPLLPQLSIGGAPDGGPAVRRAGYDVLVLCARGYQPAESFFHGVRVIRCPIADAKPTASDLIKVEMTAIHVANLIRRGAKVLVTCQAGVNRSALVCALIIHNLTGRSGKRIVAHVRDRRGPHTAMMHGMAPLCNEHFAEYMEAKRATNPKSESYAP